MTVNCEIKINLFKRPLTFSKDCESLYEARQLAEKFAAEFKTEFGLDIPIEWDTKFKLGFGKYIGFYIEQ